MPYDKTLNKHAVVAAITNAVNAAGNPPTQAEFNALVTVVNSILAALRIESVVSAN